MGYWIVLALVTLKKEQRSGKKDKDSTVHAAFACANMQVQSRCCKREDVVNRSVFIFSSLLFALDVH